MERLTHEKSRSRWNEGRCPTKYTSRHTFQEVVARLAAYEDTGLGPEEVENLKGVFNETAILKLTAQYLDTTPAEKDGRLVVLPFDKVRWIKAILAERERQDKKWGYPQENTYCEWASILSEEAGELAQALNELNFGRGSQSQMETEAVQVAAVALSILEQSAVAYAVTAQAAVALGRLTRKEAEAALKKREEAGNEVD